MSSLPVVETFHSLQGEGLHAGRSAFFIRLGGCTVGCSWCDTKHSWPQAAHPAVEVQALANEAAAAQQQGAAFVVITGGEPLHHNLDGFCQALPEMAPALQPDKALVIRVPNSRHVVALGLRKASSCCSSSFVRKHQGSKDAEESDGSHRSDDGGPLVIGWF